MDDKQYKKDQVRRRWILTIFSSKWFSFPWSYKFRNKIYSKHFNFDSDAYIEENVWIRRTHSINGIISAGKGLVLARNTDIDYTGCLEIGNNVAIAEGVKIITHGHDFFNLREDVVSKEKNLFLTNLVIHDNVTIGARSIIMHGVREIGENSVVSAGSVVTKEVPANVVVAGNPAKVIAKLHKGLKIMKTNLT